MKMFISILFELSNSFVNGFPLLSLVSFFPCLPSFHIPNTLLVLLLTYCQDVFFSSTQSLFVDRPHDSVLDPLQFSPKVISPTSVSSNTIYRQWFQNPISIPDHSSELQTRRSKCLQYLHLGHLSVIQESQTQHAHSKHYL